MTEMYKNMHQFGSQYNQDIMPDKRVNLIDLVWHGLHNSAEFKWLHNKKIFITATPNILGWEEMYLIHCVPINLNGILSLIFVKE